MRPTASRLRRAAAAFTILASAASLASCSTSDDPGADGETSNEQASISLPDTAAGQQMAWFLSASASPPIGEDELRERFTEDFLANVSPEELNSTLEQFGGFTTESIASDEPDELVIVASANEERLNIAVAVNEEGRIAGLTISPAAPEMPAPPTGWDDLDERLDGIAPDSSFLAARMDADGSCASVHERAATETVPIASVFKLFVLDAVARALGEGTISPDTTVTVRDATKSWPTGVLQDEADGTAVTVTEATELMMALSDNTATDLLIDLVGRDAVEQSFASITGDPESNAPLLNTREMFLLKAVDYPVLADEYSGLDSATAKRDFIEGTLASTGLPPVSEASGWTAPRHVDEIEWFASLSEVCEAYAALADHEEPLVEASLSLNDGGIGLDEQQWPTVWFKGGSEPGVLALSYRAVDEDGQAVFVALVSRDPGLDISDANATSGQIQDALSITKGGLNLVRE
ncbi:serine hydrolase [Hoyosella sp. G463]|uniref:Serine hydrolase n=1 Tax=Lolliginicoccus lacisalsi TaxID=2742202 RepID=A0A927PKL4_9ACTN|nr:serine hydrolase [Lolliginicoccus lacisalsi]MBD8504919.1 serine hydrolase [Lolliginicoccus lacisalsi]